MKRVEDSRSFIRSSIKWFSTYSFARYIDNNSLSAAWSWDIKNTHSKYTILIDYDYDEI
jgi:hypothetical protein